MQAPIDLIELEPDLAAELRRAAALQQDAVRSLASPQAFLEHLAVEPGGRAVLVVEDASQVGLPWLREVHRRAPQAQVLVACRRCADETWRRLLLAGCQNILQPPFTGLDLESEFAGEPAITHIFRRHPHLHEHGKTMFRYLLPSDPQYIPGVVHVVALLAMEFGFSRADYTMNLPLALDEALSNAIVHGNRRDARKRVEVEGMIDGGTLRLKVRDEGSGFRREQAQSPMDANNLLAPSGRGLFLIESVMDEVRYTQEGRCIEMIKRRDGKPA